MTINIDPVRSSQAKIDAEMSKTFRTSNGVEERKKWELRPGNTVKVWQKVKEKEKIRLQAFEGLIISHKHGFEPGATFTVRKIAEGVGCERIFPIFSPNIEKIEVIKKAKTRRAKLYYIREKAAKEIRKKMKEVRIDKIPNGKVEETAELQENEQQSAK